MRITYIKDLCLEKVGLLTGGITSGLQAPRQGYEEAGNVYNQNVQKFDTNQNIAEFLRNGIYW